MNYKKNITVPLFISVFFCINILAINENRPKNCWITIFVHGIKSIKPFLNANNILLFFTDQVKNTPYAQAVKIARQNDFFYKNQLMQGLGLKKIDIYDLKKNNATAAIANIYEKISQSVNPHHINYYYTYGWSGLLSPTARYEESEELLLSMRKEVEKFNQQGITVKVRLVGYSHGVNVIMNCAAIKNNKYPELQFIIDEFILLGGPIQLDTDYLINDPIFKKVYNIFSRKDRIQPIDFFSFNRLFSRKKFRSRRCFRIDKKVTQIDLRITRTRKTKCKETQKQYIATTSNLCNPGVISGKHELLRDISPGHIELWFFQWSPRNYRKNFPLAPLPALVYLPFFLHHVKRLKHCVKHSHTIIVDIRPEHEQLIVRQPECNSCVIQTPFILRSQQQKFAQIAYTIQPDNYTLEKYNKHLHNAIKKANKIFYDSLTCE